MTNFVYNVPLPNGGFYSGPASGAPKGAAVSAAPAPGSIAAVQAAAGTGNFDVLQKAIHDYIETTPEYAKLTKETDQFNQATPGVSMSADSVINTDANYKPIGYGGYTVKDLESFTPEHMQAIAGPQNQDKFGNAEADKWKPQLIATQGAPSTIKAVNQDYFANAYPDPTVKKKDEKVMHKDMPTQGDPTIAAMGVAKTPQEIAAATTNPVSPSAAPAPAAPVTPKPATPAPAAAPAAPAAPSAAPAPSAPIAPQTSTPPLASFNAQGVNTGNAPAGSKQSANGNWVDSSGNQYANAPGTYGSSTSAPTTSTGNSDVDALAKAQNDLASAAQSFSDTIAGISNGSVPLNPAEQAQIDGLKSQYDQLINQTKQANTNAVNSTQLRGYQTGAAEYDPTFQAKTIGAVVTAGANKVATLQTQEASAVATLTTTLENNDIAAAKSAFEAYQTANQATQDALKTTISDTQGAINDAHIASVISGGVTDPADILTALHDQGYTDISASDVASAVKSLSPDASNILDIMKTAAQNGAPQDVLQAIGTSGDVTSAITAASGFLQNPPTGDLADYTQYQKDAKAAGQVPVSFDSWQNAQAYNQAYSKAAGDAAGKGTAPATGTGSTLGQVPTQTDIAKMIGDDSVPPTVKPYLKESANGSYYIDLSGVTTQPARDAITKLMPGVTVITDKNNAQDLINIQEANKNLQVIAKIYSDIAQPTALARDLGGGPAAAFAEMAQTDPRGAAQGALKIMISNLNKAASGVTGLRSSGGSSGFSSDDLPKSTDTQDVVAQKLDNLANTINDRESSILGTQDTTANFLIRSEGQANNALVALAKKPGATITVSGTQMPAAQAITNILKQTNPDTKQPYTYLEAAQILGVDIPALSGNPTANEATGGSHIAWNDLLSGKGLHLTQ